MIAEFILEWPRLMQLDKPVGRGLDYGGLVEFFHKFSSKFMAWGSGNVLRAWLDFRAAGQDAMNAEKSAGSAESSGAPSVEGRVEHSGGSVDGRAGGGNFAQLFKFEDPIFAMRKDLGCKNSNLKKRDILRMIINDSDKDFPK